jgi:hypothetical protein
LRIGGGDEHRAATQSGQHGRLARGVQRGLQLRPRVTEESLGESEHAVPVQAARAVLRWRRRRRAERLRQPAADLVGVSVPGQCARERDRHPQRLVGRSGVQ